MMHSSTREVRPFVNRRGIPACLGVLALLGLLALTGPAAYGQVVFGSIVGSVVDQTGASVPNAVVRITLTTTNDVRTAPTDNAGTYTIPSVTPGAYTVEIVKEGF